MDVLCSAQGANLPSTRIFPLYFSLNSLIVDDEIWMIKGLEKLIQRCSAEFTVTASARDGRQALQEMEKQRFDVVFCDIHMPGMDGLELLKEMRLRQYDSPVIMITGHSEFEYARTAFRLGAIDYLLKPLNTEEIVAVMNNLKPRLEVRSIKAGAETDRDMKNGQPQAVTQDYRQGAVFVEKLKDTIKSRFYEDLSISVLAEQAGFNSSYLSRLFKLETGKGFVQMLTEQRMAESKRLLKETKQNIAEISRSVGYWDEKHFIRTFKKETGVTPAEFRRQL